MCGENMTSLTRKEDLLDLKNEGVATYQPPGLCCTSMRWPNYYSQFSHAARLSMKGTSSTNFDTENLIAKKSLTGVKPLRENSIYPIPGTRNLQFGKRCCFLRL